MVIYINYAVTVPWEAFTAEIRSKVRFHPILVIRGLPGEGGAHTLARLAKSLGRVDSTDVTAPDEGNRLVHAVQARDEPIRDDHGFPILSTTNADFPCHTDDYFEANPSDLVILQCVHQASAGGDSLAATVDDIIAHLDSATLDLLARPLFPSHFGLVPILQEHATEWRIRYNRVEIERSAQRLTVPVQLECVGALDRLDRAIEQVKTRIALTPGDCLILDNHRVVHGRTAFERGSKRLFRRVKVYT
ncbi:TauD/TfdA family dioxygenase [Nonomuraea sp. LPB2021202275-12-8]|uniref:TauD/TfdA family dioxygenase n=1 Tax=Nonomuraea sp. LPB2021202275-12-8 TaxID=3120159 RepID=UPI00300C3F7A